MEILNIFIQEMGYNNQVKLQHFPVFVPGLDLFPLFCFNKTQVAG